MVERSKKKGTGKLFKNQHKRFAQHIGPPLSMPWGLKKVAQKCIKVHKIDQDK